MNKMEETLTRISDRIINWDNWKDESTGKYWTVLEVLHCRLSLIADLSAADENDEEILETIEMVQEVLSAIESNI